MKTYNKIILACLLAIFGWWVMAAQATNITFERSDGCVIVNQGATTAAHTLRLELAQNNKQRARGLMERTVLGDVEGMLFLYPTADIRGFWMFRTRIALDIAFINADGVVLDTQQMTPCASSRASECPTYAPQQPYSAALEMAAGAFARLGIAPGSTFTLGACPNAW